MHTLLLYEGNIHSTRRTAFVLGSVIGNVTIREIEEAPDSLAEYDALCLIFNFYGALTAGKTKAYLAKHKEELKGKRIACAGVGLSDVGFARYVVALEDIVGTDDPMIGMFIRDEEQLGVTAYQIAKRLRAPLVPMPEGELLAAVDRFARSHEILTLATASEGYIRCTPLVYLYVDEKFYVLTSGGYKFRSLLTNDHVSAEIHDAYDEENENLPRLQIYGKAALVDRHSDEYDKILLKADPPSQTQERFLLRITPLKYEIIDPGFTHSGYDARQAVNTAFRKKRWEDSVLTVNESSIVQAELRDRMAMQANRFRAEQAQYYEEQRLFVKGADEDRGAIPSPLDRMIAEAEGMYEEAADDPFERDDNWFDDLPEEEAFEDDFGETAENDFHLLKNTPAEEEDDDFFAPDEEFQEKE